MSSRATVLLAAALLIGTIPATGRALTTYTQDFESLDQSDTSALANDGWLVFGNVFAPDDTYLYGYGPFPAPNDGFAFCQIDVGQGGPEQGDQQLVVFSDYNNDDHGNGNIIESNVFHEQTIEAADVGTAWAFAFQAKLGNLEGSSTAAAFIKTLDPDNGYALTNFITRDMTRIPATWSGFTLYIVIDPSLEGQILQFGFMNTASDYEGSGVFYDNIVFQAAAAADVPDGASLAGATLHQNYPNPFNPGTRIAFTLDRPTAVTVSIYDLAGRRVAAFRPGRLATGDHHVFWDGRTAAGRPAAAGQYRYVLRTETGELSRSMMLVK
jgi:hypothetical protein